MFLKISRILYASFIFALKTSIFIACLYGLAVLLTISFITDSLTDAEMIPYLMALVSAICFMICYVSFLGWILVKRGLSIPDFKGVNFVAPSLSAIVVNLYVIYLSPSELYLSIYLFNIIISIIAIFFGSRFYKKTYSKLQDLESRVDSPAHV